MRPPRAGDLRHRVRILLRQDFPDDTDGIEQARPEVATVWARIEPVGGGVYFGTVQIDKAVTHRITIRRRTDITAEHEVEGDGRRFRVKRSADLGTAREFTVLDVEELGVLT